eukprot:gene25668-11334_t
MQLSHRHLQGLATRSRGRSVCRATPPGSKLSITGGGVSKEFDQDLCKIGCSASSDLRVQTPGVAEEHAVIERRAKQFFVKALEGESMFDPSGAFLDGTEMRPRVSYLLGDSGGPEYEVTFDQVTTVNPMLEMMMKGMMPKDSQ